MNPDDWITQAEAARLRKVTRQAIGKLVVAGRIRTTKFGGKVFVNRVDTLNFEPKPVGRKRGAR